MATRPRGLAIALVFAFFLAGMQTCPAAVVAFLTTSRAISGERFETDLMFAADPRDPLIPGEPGVIGDQIEWINLDIFNSLVNAAPLTDFGRVRFDSAPRFADWQDGQQFGLTPSFESVVVLDSFASSPVSPFTIVDIDPFIIGTFTFDYSGLGLQPGDKITLDLSGRNDGSSTKTTSIAIRSASTSTTALFDPDFTSSFGSEITVFQIPTAIPEPGAAVVLGLLSASVLIRRRRRRC